MIFENLNKAIVNSESNYSNGKTGQLVFWSGTMPSQDELIAYSPTNIATIPNIAHVYQSLLDLGCQEIHRTNFKNLPVRSLNNSITFDLSGASSEDSNIQEGIPDFAIFMVNNRSDWYHSTSAVRTIYIGTVGLIGSGADIELKDLNLTASSKVRLGSFTFELI